MNLVPKKTLKVPNVIANVLPDMAKRGKVESTRIKRIRAILAAPTVFAVAAPMKMTEARVQDARIRFYEGEGIVDIAASYGYDATDSGMQAFVDATGIKPRVSPTSMTREQANAARAELIVGEYPYDILGKYGFNETDDDVDVFLGMVKKYADDKTPPPPDIRFGRTEFFDAKDDTIRGENYGPRRETQVRAAYQAVYKLAEEFGLFNVGGDLEREAEDRDAPLSSAWRPEPQLVVIRALPPDRAGQIEIKKVFGRGMLVISINWRYASPTEGGLRVLLLHELLHIQIARGKDSHGDEFIKRMGEVLDAAVARGIIAPYDVWPQVFGPDVWAARAAYVALRKRNSRLVTVKLAPMNVLRRMDSQRTWFSVLRDTIQRPAMPGGKVSPFAPNQHR